MQRLNSSSMPTINLSNIEAAQVSLHGAALAPPALTDDLRSGHLHCYRLWQAAAASWCSRADLSALCITYRLKE